MEVPGHLGESEAELRDLLHGKLKQGRVVRFEMDLSARPQDLSVQLEKIPVGQAALGVPFGGPGVAEVNIDAVHLAGLEEGGKLIGVGVHEKDVVQPLGSASLHAMSEFTASYTRP